MKTMLTSCIMGPIFHHVNSAKFFPQSKSINEKKNYTLLRQYSPLYPTVRQLKTNPLSERVFKLLRCPTSIQTSTKKSSFLSLKGMTFWRYTTPPSTGADSKPASNWLHGDVLRYSDVLLWPTGALFRDGSLDGFGFKKSR